MAGAVHSGFMRDSLISKMTKYMFMITTTQDLKFGILVEIVLKIKVLEVIGKVLEWQYQMLMYTLVVGIMASSEFLIKI